MNLQRGKTRVAVYGTTAGVARTMVKFFVNDQRSRVNGHIVTVNGQWSTVNSQRARAISSGSLARVGLGVDVSPTG